ASPSHPSFSQSKAPPSSPTLEGSSPLQPSPGPISLFLRGGEGRGVVWQGRASPPLPTGCSDPALPSAPMPGGAGTPAPELRPLKRRPVPGKHYQCSSYGCKLAFPSMQELMDHLKVHYRPTQSLEGKTFHCPTLGCTETFPSMQDLMAHMKVHYKPNRYFKCENCLLRFRTHRSLFKHLHVCSDSASGPAPPPRAERPVPPPAAPAPEKEPPAKPPEGLPKLPRRSSSSSSSPGSSAPSIPSMSPGWTPLCPALGGHSPAPCSRLGVLPLAREPPSVRGSERGGSSPRHSSNSRIVWEHTRGRYSCTQCPFSTASRDEMTLHTEDHRKNPP
ncbi:ZN414 protein, partial [Daphoenositta chrysoptera]|nr:ZN414 protein [Daphoenositta chrysoptera]